LKLGHREGDRAELAIIELVDNPREVEAARSREETSKGRPLRRRRKGRGKEAKEEAAVETEANEE
jgi:hypothetical protein